MVWKIVSGAIPTGLMGVFLFVLSCLLGGAVAFQTIDVGVIVGNLAFIIGAGPFVGGIFAIIGSTSIFAIFICFLNSELAKTRLILFFLSTGVVIAHMEWWQHAFRK